MARIAATGGAGVDHVHWHGLAGNMGNKGDVWVTSSSGSGWLTAEDAILRRFRPHNGCGRLGSTSDKCDTSCRWQ